MRNSRLRFSVSTALFAFVSLMLMVLTGCQQEPPKPVPGTAHKAKTYDCGDGNDIVVKMDPGMKNGVDKQAIYVCAGDKVVWQPAGSSVTTFQVQFAGDCPFTSRCSSPITNSSEQTVIDPLPNDLSVYKYSLSINGHPVSDPHVVGGGGY